MSTARRDDDDDDDDDNDDDDDDDDEAPSVSRNLLLSRLGVEVHHACSDQGFSRGSAGCKLNYRLHRFPGGMAFRNNLWEISTCRRRHVCGSA